MAFGAAGDEHVQHQGGGQPATIVLQRQRLPGVGVQHEQGAARDAGDGAFLRNGGGARRGGHQRVREGGGGGGRDCRAGDGDGFAGEGRRDAGGDDGGGVGPRGGQGRAAGADFAGAGFSL